LVVGNVDPYDLSTEVPSKDDQPARHDPVTKDLLPVVHVVDEAVERPDALSQTRLYDRPLARRQDPRNGIEWQDALGGVILTVRVDGERHTPVEERPVGELCGTPKLGTRHGRDLR